ncbi:MAG: Sepiapterin reductase [Verrucomicrobiales bacterium]|nr:Sepiapterin reductase [Verrucomicrobiales bacterium]
MTKTAIITGAGSGVGRAIAIALAREQWKLTIVGRQKAPLEETKRMAESADVLVAPCDLRDEADVTKMVQQARERFGFVSTLIYAAGINVPRRSWSEVSTEDFRSILDTNLTGAFFCSRALIGEMRKNSNGTIVHIVSDAAKQASAKSGVAYSASKFAQAGLVQSINAEERGNGIRACAIFPGDINTPLLDKRQSPPPPEARAKMLRPEDIAQCVLLALNLPERAIVEEIVIRPR